MISKECSIEAFTAFLKDKDSQTVIAMAVEEATEADRLILKKKSACSDGVTSNLLPAAQAVDRLSPLCRQTP
ncbi:hypothetical protein [Desulfosarcina variabilis]|uniref:hypothetical protein n=1 Tax=Desulfosarcina variabilis TaxID=2300 RepID=UPI003AFB2D74